ENTPPINLNTTPDTSYNTLDPMILSQAFSSTNDLQFPPPENQTFKDLHEFSLIQQFHSTPYEPTHCANVENNFFFGNQDFISDPSRAYDHFLSMNQFPIVGEDTQKDDSIDLNPIN
ncbi:10899_t:CDS:1, partial [Acaulospora colombiana]